MRYEHLVAVNDLADPFGFLLSRAQLWRGLLLRVEQPALFVPGVESLQLTELSPGSLLREMQLGALRVRDRITLREAQQIDFQTEASAQHRGGSLTLCIEEPEAESLFVRFCYDTPASVDPEDIQYEAYLKEMWRQVDVDSIRLIREWAAAGRLDATAQ